LIARDFEVQCLRSHAYAVSNTAAPLLEALCAVSQEEHISIAWITDSAQRLQAVFEELIEAEKTATGQ